MKTGRRLKALKIKCILGTLSFCVGHISPDPDPMYFKAGINKIILESICHN